MCRNIHGRCCSCVALCKSRWRIGVAQLLYVIVSRLAAGCGPGPPRAAPPQHISECDAYRFVPSTTIMHRCILRSPTICTHSARHAGLPVLTVRAMTQALAGALRDVLRGPFSRRDTEAFAHALLRLLLREVRRPDEVHRPVRRREKMEKVYVRPRHPPVCRTRTGRTARVHGVLCGS